MVDVPRDRLDPGLLARQLELCREKLQEIEKLLQSGMLEVGEVRSRIAALAAGIARQAPHGGIADLARKVRFEVEDPHSRRLDTYLWHLKGELGVLVQGSSDSKA